MNKYKCIFLQCSKKPENTEENDTYGKVNKTKQNSRNHTKL